MRRLREQLLQMLSGAPDGVPDWVTALAEGDDEGYFGPESAVWVVHGGIPVLIAGMRALLMQTLHPGAMAGVHDWSRYREDPLGRLSGTVRWVLTTSFGDRAQAEQACAFVANLHTRVQGNYERGGETREYSAADPALLSWVHVAFADSFLRCHQTWGKPIPGGADAYVSEWAAAGGLMGVHNPPKSEAELRDQLSAFGPELQAGERVRDAVRFIRKPPLHSSDGGRLTRVGYSIVFAGAIATIPPEYRRMLGVRRAWWPAITITGWLLALLGRLLGRPSTSESYATRRVAALRARSGE
ncbi:MAG: hypothetical protein JWQ39_69 [Glaciihabitans sp.]|jgi:uncharacterized protein (DUF2236 family)|nr:hypothetical protein [Glaciihabitans sp.]